MGWTRTRCVAVVVILEEAEAEEEAWSSSRSRSLLVRRSLARHSSLVTRQARYWNASTPLIYAADYGRVETIKHLVEVHSVNVHARNVYGKTAFDVAKAERHKECAQVLLQYMIDRSPFFLGQRSRGEETG